MSSREERRWEHYEANQTTRKIKQLKRNRKPKQARSRDWLPDNVDNLDELDEISLPHSERVMPRGERERRKAMLTLALTELEREKLQDHPADVVPDEHLSGQRGVVVEVSSSLCRVEVDGRSLLCGLRGNLGAEDTGYTNVVAVGDEVLVSGGNGTGRGMVETVLPRRTVLMRPDPPRAAHFQSYAQQAIVANADQLLIVAAWREPAIWMELIDRYIIAATRYTHDERRNLLPIVCVNKVDLAEDLAACRATLQPYLDLGQRVLFTSARTGEGVDELREVLRGKTTVLTGLSGVGKSSLLAAVQPGLQLRTTEVNEHSGEGRHTTTQAVMLNLAMGGYVVDTPGVREFGLSGLPRAELLRFYPEIAATASGCRFSNCSHVHEPGCAVREAVQQGRLPASRYHSYKKIYADLPD